MSVVFASSRQQHIGMLNNALSIRLWLSRGKVELDKRKYRMPFNRLPLESSVAVLKQFNMPKVILRLAVILYTVGFGIYLLYAWLYRVEPEGGPNDFRNIFIAFVATVGILYIYVVAVSFQAHTAARKRTADFRLDRSTTFAKPAEQRQLEEWLRILQDMHDCTIESGEAYHTLEAAVTDLQSKWETERVARDERIKAKREEKRRQHEQANQGA